MIKYYQANTVLISEISGDVAQVIFAGLVVGTFTQETMNWSNFILGMILSGMFWWVKIISYKK